MGLQKTLVSKWLSAIVKTVVDITAPMRTVEDGSMHLNIVSKKWPTV